MRLRLRTSRRDYAFATGRHRPRVRRQRLAGLPLDAEGARLIAALTEKLGCRVVLTRNRWNNASGVLLLGPNGSVLGVEKDKGRRTLMVPVPVAVLPDDPTDGISGQLEAVPQHGIDYLGSVSQKEPEELAAILARHYRAALDPEAPVWTPETRWAQ